MKYYFAYGADLNSEIFDKICPSLEKIASARLDDYEFFVDESGKPNIKKSVNEHVYGGIWRISDSDFNNLESPYSLGLLQTNVKIEKSFCSGGIPKDAEIFTCINKSSSFGICKDASLQDLFYGALDFDLPEFYLEFTQRFYAKYVFIYSKLLMALSEGGNPLRHRCAMPPPPKGGGLLYLTGRRKAPSLRGLSPQATGGVCPQTQKSPGGRPCSHAPGRKGDGFLLIGIIDLECHRDIAVSSIRPDDDAKIRPAAIALHVNICSGQFLADFFLDLRQDLSHNKAIVIPCGHCDGQVFLILAIHMDFADQLCAKKLNAGVQVLLQISIRNSLQALIVFFHAACLCLARELAKGFFFFILVSVTKAAAATAAGCEHQHGQSACQKQGNDLRQFLHRVSLQSVFLWLCFFF